MDNQQERLDKVYLACAIECEGHISLQYGRKTYNKDNGDLAIQILPRVGFTNKDDLLTEKVVRISKAHNIGCHVGSDCRLNGCKQTLWNGMKRVKSLLEFILPELLAKKERAEIVLEFINSRLSNPNIHEPYSLKEWFLFREIRMKNGKGRNTQIDEKISRILRDYMPDAQK